MKNSFIHKDTLNFYSRKQNWRSVLVILLEWGMIAGIFAFCAYLDSFWAYLIGALFISTRMYAFYSLTHEACHYHLNNDKRINDIMGNLLIAWPVFSDIKEMRTIHMKHHKHLQTDQDPEMKHLLYDEFQFPLSRKSIILIVLKDLTGFNFIRYRIPKLFNLSPFQSWNIPQYLYYGVILIVLVYTKLLIPFLILWIIPYMTIYQLLNRIRLYYEHFNFPERKEYQTRTLHLSKVSAFFLSPYGLGYHAEHHLFPSIPFYHLRKLHTELVHQEDFLNGVEVEKSYFSMLKKLFGNEV